VSSPLSAGARHEVTDADTATALGSGDVPVLATPRLIAWMEAATVEVAAHLVGPGETTVGVAIRVQHRRATPVGRSVEVTAALPGGAVDRALTFSVEAVDEAGHVVATGEIDRAVVERARFLATASRPSETR
jgi:predicted thioesterase